MKNKSIEHEATSRISLLSHGDQKLVQRFWYVELLFLTLGMNMMLGDRRVFELARVAAGFCMCNASVAQSPAQRSTMKDHTRTLPNRQIRKGETREQWFGRTAAYAEMLRLGYRLVADPDASECPRTEMPDWLAEQIRDVYR
jgi:hypothetical protein